MLYHRDTETQSFDCLLFSVPLCVCGEITTRGMIAQLQQLRYT